MFGHGIAVVCDATPGDAGGDRHPASRPMTRPSRRYAGRWKSSVRIDELYVRVWLFGALSALTPERPLVLCLTERFTAGDVIARLGDRLGDEFVSRVLSAPGEKFSHCRIFVDGFTVEALDEPLETGDTAEIEFILMIAPEGG